MALAGMIFKKASKVGSSVFGLKRGIDYILRPALMLFMIGIVSAVLRFALLGTVGVDLVIDASITVLVGVPFVGLGYLMLVHQEREQRSLISVAQTDDLTGLPNRRAFSRRSERALRAGRDGYFVIIDADHFKRVNDTLGHPSGDVCLQAIADRIKGVLRKDDLIGRIGGEEFGVLLFDRSMEDLQRFSGRLCFPIKVSLPGHPEPLRLTVSAGATRIVGDDTMSSVATRADEALIAAKKSGRERMVLWRRKSKKKDAA